MVKFLDEMFMFLGLVLDVIIVAFVKAYTRRRRPKKPHDEILLAMDKFSFPSGHGSRSAYLVTFTALSLLPLSLFSFLVVLCLVLWGLAVAASRIALQRHYILDVTAGCFLGLLLAFSQRGIFWASEEWSHSFAHWMKYGLMSDYSI